MVSLSLDHPVGLYIYRFVLLDWLHNRVIIYVAQS